MMWFVFGTMILVGGILFSVRDTKASEGRPFVDRSSLRRLGTGMLAIGATLLIGYLILIGLANWVSDDL